MTEPAKKHTITQAQLLAVLTGKGDGQVEWWLRRTGDELENELQEFTRPNQQYILLKDIAFSDLEENAELLLKGLDTDVSFMFVRCTLPPITLSGSSTGDWLFFNTLLYSITLERNSRCGDVVLYQGSQASHISISKDCRAANIHVNTNSRCCGIDIQEASTVQSIEIGWNSSSWSIQCWRNSQLSKIILHHDSKCQNISLESSRSDEISITSRSRAGNIYIGKDSVLEFLEVISGAVTGDLHIFNSKVSKIYMQENTCSILLSQAHIPTAQISGCRIHRLFWKGSTRGEMYIEQGSINHLCFNRTILSKDSIVSITDSQIYIAQLQELLVQGQLILHGVEAAAIPFKWMPHAKEYNSDYAENIYSQSEVIRLKEEAYARELKKLDTPELRDRKKPLFLIANSSMGKAEITGSDLSCFNFEYRDSKLLETFILGTRLPRETIGIYHPGGATRLTDKEYHKQKISIYNQLKKIFENQGDIVESTWHHSKAMAHEERLLALQYADKPDRRLRKWWSEEAFDLFNFRLNKWSNNHGESWRRALCFSFYVLFPVYMLFFISVNYRKPLSLHGAADFIGGFFSFLDITHKSDFLSGNDKPPAISRVIDFFGRVMTGYCIYQFVAAFRKHGKKV